jgi:hypothetical protein
VAGKHKPGYRAPRTGQKRKTRQPFVIDGMNEKVRAEIQQRRAKGETWQEISDASLEFAGRAFAVSLLQRWYDVRVEQVHREVMAQSDRARELAAAFAGKGFEKLPEAVQAALSSALFALAEDHDDASRGKFIKGMGELAWLLARNRQLDQEDQRLKLEAKKLDSVASKVRGLKGEIGKKKLTSEELAKKLDEIYDIAS